MVFVSRLPEHVSIVMFKGHDRHGDAGGFHVFTPVIGIDDGGREDGWVFFSVAPFASSKGVGAKVDEADEAVAEVVYLALGRDDVGRLGDDGFRGIGGFDFLDAGEFNGCSGAECEERNQDVEIFHRVEDMKTY